MRFKRCSRCGHEWSPATKLADMAQTKCPDCQREYARALVREPRKPEPCKVCGKPTQDYRASVKFCPEHRHQIREKTCTACGKKWMPPNWTIFTSRTHCHPCWLAKRRIYRRGLTSRKPRACATCGKSTGDLRQNVRYCPEHTWVGEWWDRWKARAARTEAERVVRLAELERMKPYLEKSQWLATAKKELAKTRRLLRERGRGQPQSPAAESRPRATSQR